MAFEVEALSDGDYARWIAGAHDGSPPLDSAAYGALAQPSKAVPPSTFGAVEPDLFDAIVRGSTVTTEGADGRAAPLPTKKGS
jgi:cytochrome o ubiquinol oxidase subunit 2